MLAYQDENDFWREWHIGDGIPREIVHGRVMRLQADGHELAMIQNAMRLAFVAANGEVQFSRHDYGDID